MKTIEGFKLRKVCNETVLVPEGINLVNFNKMVSMNSTAAFLWEALQGKEFTVEDMAALLTKEYDVSEEQALKDCGTLADKWIETGIAEK